MAGRIPQEFLDQLLARTDLVEIVNSRVPLRRAGREFMACCPFHAEKTPSFSVSPRKQFYHCFGCRAHGNAIGFLMAYERLDFIDTIEELARLAGLDLPPLQGGVQGPSIKPLLEWLAQAERFFRQQLREHPLRQRAVDYLRQRGLTGQIANTFGIGYAPPGWDHLSNALREAGATAAAALSPSAGERWMAPPPPNISIPRKPRFFIKARNSMAFMRPDTITRTCDSCWWSKDTWMWWRWPSTIFPTPSPR